MNENMYATTLTVGFSLSIQTRPTGRCATCDFNTFSVYVPAIHTVYTKKEKKRNTACIYKARQNCRLNTNIPVNCIYNQVTLTRANTYLSESYSPFNITTVCKKCVQGFNILLSLYTNCHFSTSTTIK
jgi:hypothetical protein